MTFGTTIVAYIGLLCSAGALQSNKQSVEEVRVTDGDGNEIFLLVMNQKPFKILIRCILEKTTAVSTKLCTFY